MRTIRIIFGSNGIFDMQADNAFDYPRFLTAVRADGYFLNPEGVFIPYHAIRMILPISPEQAHGLSEAQGATRQ